MNRIDELIARWDRYLNRRENIILRAIFVIVSAFAVGVLAYWFLFMMLAL